MVFDSFVQSIRLDQNGGDDLQNEARMTTGGELQHETEAPHATTLIPSIYPPYHSIEVQTVQVSLLVSSLAFSSFCFQY